MPQEHRVQKHWLTVFLFLSLFALITPPLFASPDISKATTQFQNGSLDGALRTLGTAKDLQSRILRGQIESVLNPPSGQEFLTALMENPKNASALAFAGYAYSQWKDGKAKALEYLKQSLAIDAQNADAHSILGRLLFKAGNRAGGMQEMLKARVLAPKSILVLHNLADSYIDELSTGKALNELNKMIQYHPALPLAYFYRARYFEELGQPEKAISDYNKALQINSRFRPASSYKAALLLRNGQFAEAIATAGCAVPIHTKNEDDATSCKALRVRTDAEIALHQDRKAIEDIDRIAGKQSQMQNKKLKSDAIADLVMMRAKAYERVGNWQGAATDLGILKSNGRTGTEIWLLQAKLLEDKNEDTAALVLYNKLINSGLPAPEFYRGRARVYAKLGKSNLAEADLKKGRDLEAPHF